MKKVWQQVVRFYRWLKNLDREEYDLTVWYVFEVIEQSNQSKVTRRTSKTYRLTRLDKCTNYHIVGKDENGSRFEIKTIEPFDYQITKLR